MNSLDMWATQIVFFIVLDQTTTLALGWSGVASWSVYSVTRYLQLILVQPWATAFIMLPASVRWRHAWYALLPLGVALQYLIFHQESPEFRRPTEAETTSPSTTLLALGLDCFIVMLLYNVTVAFLLAYVFGFQTLSVLQVISMAFHS